MYSNKEIAKIFKLTAQLFDLYDENPFKIKSYQSAAFKIERVEKPLAMLKADELSLIDGIGKTIAGKIVEIAESGTLQDLEKLVSITPPGVLEMLNIKGIGPKKVRTIWKELKIETIGELLYACNENRLIEVKGFGDKIQEQIRKAIQFNISNEGKFHYASVEEAAFKLEDLVRESEVAPYYSLTGAIRRKCEVVEQIELLIGTDDVDAIHTLIKNNPKYVLKEETSATSIYGATEDCFPFVIYICSPDEFHWRLFVTTGSKEHVSSLDKKGLLNVFSEREIYEANKIPFVIPELREPDSPKPPSTEIIEMSHLKGILHVHTTYSDGVHSLEEMALYCRELGYEYLGVSDHSQSAFYANGLKPHRIQEQHNEIALLNAKLAPFKIFKGIESDILNDGSLDYPEEILSSFDFVIASVHSNLKMDKEKATNRLLKAIENPYTTILGHPTGRLLLIREGYQIDTPKIIDACAANGVIIELNANPYRLDLDWRWISYALDKGVKISINPDSHSKEGYNDMYYGVCAARKGALTRAMTFNALDQVEIGAYFNLRKSYQPVVR